MKPVLKKLLTAAAGLPLLWILPNCSFNPQGAHFRRGATPHSGTIFCDIEKGPRRCASAMDEAMGIDIARPFQEGFWIGRTSNIGLDKSYEAFIRCGGRPEAIEFRCPFPTGCQACLNCGQIGGVYGDVAGACVDLCRDEQLQRPAAGDRPCTSIARASTGATACFAGACTDSGAPLPDWPDPRRATPTPTPPTPTPVAYVNWVDRINTTVQTGTVLLKTSTVVDWNAGASSEQLLMSGAGHVDFIASGTGTDRMCGLSIGGHPDNDPNFTDIDYAVYLRGDMPLIAVFEAGVQRVLPVPVPYASGDEIRVAVGGDGVVRYSRNGTVFFTSTVPVSYPLRVDAALFSPNATVSNARVVF
jgi:hypothetical protein